MGPLMARLKVLPLIAALFLGCSYFFNANMKEEAFYKHPLWYR